MPILDEGLSPYMYLRAANRQILLFYMGDQTWQGEMSLFRNTPLHIQTPSS